MKLQITNDIIAEAYGHENKLKRCHDGCLIATTVREYISDSAKVHCGASHIRLYEGDEHGTVIWVGESVTRLIADWSNDRRVSPQEIEINIPAHFLREDTEIDLAQPTATQQVARTEVLAHAK